MEINNPKDAVQYAIQCEVEAEHFYEDVAAKVTHQDMKAMFLSFAGEEKKHQTILRKIDEDASIGTQFKGGSDYGVAETVPMPEVTDELTLSDAFAIAMKNEENAMTMYLNMAADATTEKMKTVFSDLADMEKGHKFKMETFYTDVSFPEVW